MKRFVFRLQKVLDAREIAEREAQRRLGEAQFALMELEQTRNAIYAELEELREQQREMLGGTVTAGAAMQHHRWQRELEKALRVQNEKVSEAEKAVAKRRAELLEATREKKVLERLKEKQRGEHNRLLQSEQQATLDDIGGQKTWRRGVADGAEPYAGHAS